MPPSDASGPQDQLAFEREKWKAQSELEQRKLALMEREQASRDLDLETRRHEQARSKWSSPLVVAIFAAAIAGLSNAAVTVVNDHLQRDIESDKAAKNQKLEESKAESTRILEMIKTGDPDVAAKNLSFLVETGLIVEPERLDRLQAYLASRKPGSGPALPAATSRFGFEQSEALTSSVETSLENSLREFIAYLDKVGFPRDSSSVNIRVTKGVNNAYYDASKKLIVIDPTFSVDIDVPRHEYMHHVLMNIGVTTSDMASLGIESGLADYFVCSFANRPAFGKLLAPALKLSTPYVRNLENSRTWDEVKTHPDPWETGEILGGALWEIRARLGQDVADPLILAAFQASGASAETFAAGLLSAAADRAADKVNQIKAILRARKFPIST